MDRRVRVAAKEDAMRKWLMAGTGVIAAVLCLGLVGWAVERGEWGQGFGDRGPHWMGQRLLALLENDRVKSELGLSDQQADRLRQIVVDAEKSSVKTRADLAVRGIELRELLRADNPDRGAVMKKVQEVSDLRGQMMKQHVEALLAAKTVLTPEQQKKIRAFIERRHGGGFRRERFGEHRGGWGPPPEPPGRAPEPPRNPPEPPVQ